MLVKRAHPLLHGISSGIRRCFAVGGRVGTPSTTPADPAGKLFRPAVNLLASPDNASNAHSMRTAHARLRRVGWATGLCLLWFAKFAFSGDLWPFILPEQTSLEVRDPSELPHFPLASIPRPATVSDPQTDLPPRNLSLNEAIALGLANSEVVRVLAGASAVSSGRTVYDAAISNTQIDQQRARFDPAVRAEHFWNSSEPPNAFFDPLDPTRAIIGGTRTGSDNLDFGLSKQTSTGGTVDFGVNSNASRFRPGVFPLNPQTGSSVDLSYTQPLLQGGGLAVNRIPIVLARIDTERSFFQYKDSVQQHVQGIIAAYWLLVFARTDLWAREQQVQQAEFANQRSEKAAEVGLASAGEVSQTRVALENFRVALLAAQANLLQREAALRNILGLPPYEPHRIVPVTPPNAVELRIDWQQIVDLGEQQRPDIIELKLIVEADEQLLRQSRNQATPRVDATALYRWNGLEGEMPIGSDLRSRAGQFTDWSLGVNFSVPLGLRSERAALRQQELLIARDRANLAQGVHQMVHTLAGNLRNLDQFYAQYKRLQAVREAAALNLEQQTRAYVNGLIQFITVLQAIVDWGNAISSEAQALTQYNTELANLELATGTILQAHGVAFYEERFGSIGPLGRFKAERLYPSQAIPAAAVDRYPSAEQPAEESFDLQNPFEQASEADSSEDSQYQEPPPLPPLDEPTSSGAASFKRLPPVGSVDAARTAHLPTLNTQ